MMLRGTLGIVVMLAGMACGDDDASDCRRAEAACAPGFVCVELASGWDCAPADGGARDGGMRDAGALDAQTDAPSGTDAGASDAGRDAGTDAGTPARFALSFDGDGDQVSFPTDIGDLGNTFTFEAWVRPTSTAGGASGEGALVFGHRADCSDLLLEWSGDADGRVPGTFKFRVYPAPASCGWVVAESPTTSAVGTWHHVAGVFDAGALRLYVDGARVAEATQPAPITWGASLGHWAGRDGWHADSRRHGLIGEIDEIRVSDTARYSGGTITPPEHFDADADTVALWLFDEGTGSSTTDGSGNGLDGEVMNATWVTVAR